MNKIKICIFIGIASLYTVSSSGKAPAVKENVAENTTPGISYFDEQSKESYINYYRQSHEEYQQKEEEMSDKIHAENMRMIRSRRSKRAAFPWPVKSKSEKIVKKPKKLEPLVESNRQGRELFVPPKNFIKFGVEDAILTPEETKHERPKRSANPEPAQAPKRTRKQKKSNTTSIETTQAPLLPTVLPRETRERKYVPSPPRDIIKFELSDAKIPGSESSRNFRLPFEIADKKNSTKTKRRSRAAAIFKRDTPPNPMDDQSINESRKIKIVTPLSSRKAKVQLYEDLPIPIQKAIDGAVFEHRKKNGNTGDYLKFYYGDKIIRAPKNYKPFSPTKETTDGGIQSNWAPIMKPSQPLTEYKYEDPFAVNTKFLGAKPSYTPLKTVVKQDTKEKNKVHLKDKPIPLKFDNLKGKITVEPSISISYDLDDHNLDAPNPYGPVEIALSTPSTLINIPSHKAQSYVNFKTPKGGYKIKEDYEIKEDEDDDSAFPQLSALIGKKPNEQLKKLSEILKNDPKKSTSPILFPTSPVPPLAIEEPESYAVITSEEDPKEYKFKIHSVPKYVHIPKYQKVTKQFVPITENISENYEGVYKGLPLQIPAKEKRVVHSVKASPNQSHNEKSYEFGYRVTDFKTGNNFGHTQKSEKEGVTSGEYHILLPDGRVQNVHYYADDDGFHADVSYSSIHEP